MHRVHLMRVVPFFALALCPCGIAADTADCNPARAIDEFGFAALALPAGNEIIAVTTRNNAIVEGASIRAHFTTFTGFDAAEALIEVLGPSGSVLVSGADLGWSGEGSFVGEIQTAALNGPVYTLPDPFATWIIVVTATLNSGGGFAGPGGQFTTGSRLQLDLRLFPCPGDVDGSGYVDFDDLNTVLGAFDATPAGDTDCDGDTDFADLNTVLSAWAVSCDCAICS